MTSQVEALSGPNQRFTSWLLLPRGMTFLKERIPQPERVTDGLKALQEIIDDPRHRRLVRQANQNHLRRLRQ